MTGYPPNMASHAAPRSRTEMALDKADAALRGARTAILSYDRNARRPIEEIDSALAAIADLRSPEHPEDKG